MKGGMGLIGLLVVLLIIGVLVKKQLSATGQVAAPQGTASAAAAAGVALPGTAPGATVKEQSQQMQQQAKQQVEAALQQGAQQRKDADDKEGK